jgi:hypothetical protein
MSKALYSLFTYVTIYNYLDEGENMQHGMGHLREIVIDGRIIVKKSYLRDL